MLNESTEAYNQPMTDPVSAIKSIPRFHMLSEKDAREVVRVVLEAIRDDPGHAAMMAGIEAESYRSLGERKVKLVWRAMIDALIAEVRGSSPPLILSEDG